MVHAALEDFTTWTEVDNLSKITVTKTNITWAYKLNINATDSSVWYDYGAGNFGEFEHQFGAMAGVVQSWAPGNPVYCLGNVSQATNAALLADNEGIGVLARSEGGSYKLKLWQYSDDDSDTFAATRYATHYFTLIRDDSAVTAYVYAEEARTTLSDTLTVTFASTTYRYAASGNNNGGGYCPSIALRNLEFIAAGGWTHIINSVANASIAKINGVAKASIAKVNQT